MAVEEPQLMHYPTNVARQVMVPDILSHKKERGVTATHYLESKFDELKEAYFKLVKVAEDTDMVYSAVYNLYLLLVIYTTYTLIILANYF